MTSNLANCVYVDEGVKRTLEEYRIARNKDAMESHGMVDGAAQTEGTKLSGYR